MFYNLRLDNRSIIKMYRRILLYSEKPVLIYQKIDNYLSFVISMLFSKNARYETADLSLNILR
jgi:hypothetical protein